MVAAPSELNVLKSSQMPEVNSQTYEEYYEVEEDLMQYLCNPKPHGQNDIQRKGV